ncbi:MAG: molybdopterin-binding/glycosyltransferase family 2 protein [Alphaproteobacteria bacterium]|nr:molybdopterin-binding/glycosyltransferase family 2 protein [Alphaproteobacteria bacterium]
MHFGPVPPQDAEGAILAHSLDAGGRRLKKGRVLSADDCVSLAKAGLAAVTVCRLGPDDRHEDLAADMLAAAATGHGLSCSAAFTGRVNMIADAPGILVYDDAALRALNRVDEGITLAALPPFSRVAARQMVATAKIIPFGVPQDALNRALPTAPLLNLHPFRPVPLSLIQTELPGTKPSVLDKTETVMEDRARSLGARMSVPVRCRHDEDALTGALKEAASAAPTAITVVGASAIVDRRDVIPAAIEAAGGEILHFGMPVDPGNLLLLGRIGDIPVIGAPGCVRSPKPNGYDWVLERLVAGLPVDGPAIMEMGSGGFLKEIPSRPLPRAEADPAPPAMAAPRIAGILLAAGQSRRMGPVNKLLETLDGKSLVRHAAETMLAAGVDSATAVTGHESDRVRKALDGLDMAYTLNPDYARGLSETVKRGVASVPDEADGALICLGDMPRVQASTIRKLIAAFDPVEGRSICVPVHNGKRGNPVLLSRRFFAEIMELSGDSGAKALISAYEDQVAEVAVDDPFIFLDLDTPEALEQARSDSALKG